MNDTIDNGSPEPIANTVPATAEYSVAMCCYNGSRFVKEQLDSILGQTVRCSDVVVQDDRSSDGTFEQVVSMADGRTELRALRNDSNLGVRKNFESAIAKVRHEIVFLSDQDDIWRKDKVRVFLDAIGKHPDGLLFFSDATVIDETLSKISTLGCALGFSHGQAATLNNGTSGLLEILRRPFVTGAASCLRRELFEIAAPFPEKGFHHDEWLALVAVLMGRIIHIPSDTMEYRVHANNQVGVRRGTFDFGMLAKRWCECREGIHSRTMGERARIVAERMEQLSRVAKTHCFDGLFSERAELLREWVEYMNARSVIEAAPWANRSLYAKFNPNPTLAMALDSIEGILRRKP